MTGIEQVTSFRGRWSTLSNFHGRPFRWRGKIWPTAEHAFQAAKCADPAEAEAVRTAGSPGAAKRLGRRAVLRPGWNGIRIEEMRSILDAKFADPEAAAVLRSSGGADLIEGNTWGDRFWGVSGGRGENYLGRLLMEVRDRLPRDA